MAKSGCKPIFIAGKCIQEKTPISRIGLYLKIGCILFKEESKHEIADEAKMKI